MIRVLARFWLVVGLGILVFAAVNAAGWQEASNTITIAAALLGVALFLGACAALLWDAGSIREKSQ